MLFVIDCADRERIQEAKEELYRILASPELRGAPIVIVANKQDLPGLLLSYYIYINYVQRDQIILSVSRLYFLSFSLFFTNVCSQVPLI